MIRTFLLALLGLGFALGAAEAAPCTVTNAFTSGTTASAGAVNQNFTDVLNCINSLPLGNGTPAPQGRLTLATGAPVMTGAQTGKTVIYYTPYVGNQIVVTTNGTSFTAVAFSELSNATTASSTGNAGPAAVAANGNYDLFVWSNSGTLVLTRGPVWTSDTARGTGAGTTELQRVAGVWTNKNAITNGPTANLGTYVGTVRSNGSSQIDWNPNPAAAAGGATAILGVFNVYNRVLVGSSSQDNTASWSYTTATWRALNGSTSNRISYIDGLGEVSLSAALSTYVQVGTVHFLGINRDSTSAAPSLTGATWNGNSTLIAQGPFAPSLGFHYLQAMEIDTGGASATVFGNGAPAGAGITSQLQSFTANLEL